MRGRSAGGFTLIEVSVALAVGIVLLAAVTGIVTATTQSMDQVSRNVAIDTNLSRTMEVFLNDFRRAELSSVVIGTVDPDHDTIRFQTVGPRTGTTVSTGADDESNTFQDGWTVYFRVDSSGNLFRELLNSSGGFVASRRIASGIDSRFDSGAGIEKGFSVTRVAGTNLYNILIRMIGSYRDGGAMRRELRTTVLLRN